jgi:hypothetical protein
MFLLRAVPHVLARLPIEIPAKLPFTSATSLGNVEVWPWRPLRGNPLCKSTGRRQKAKRLAETAEIAEIAGISSREADHEQAV